MADMTLLLQGVVGSTAYGLAHSQSDIDRLGVVVYPTHVFLGFDKPNETIHRTGENDFTHHEVGKFLKLAMTCNPTILELLWLEENLYEWVSGPGEELLENRKMFLSAKAVRNSYLGYATQQFKKLEARGDGTFSADTRNRSLKHARHLIRLLDAGLELYRNGTMSVRVKDPDNLRWLAEQFVNTPSLASDYIAMFEDYFDDTDTPLPETPDREFWENFLLDIRRKFWNNPLGM